jgi:hypothetical protein
MIGIEKHPAQRADSRPLEMEIPQLTLNRRREKKTTGHPRQKRTQHGTLQSVTRKYHIKTLLSDDWPSNNLAVLT